MCSLTCTDQKYLQVLGVHESSQKGFVFTQSLTASCVCIPKTFTVRADEDVGRSGREMSTTPRDASFSVVKRPKRPRLFCRTHCGFPARSRCDIISPAARHIPDEKCIGPHTNEMHIGAVMDCKNRMLTLAKMFREQDALGTHHPSLTSNSNPRSLKRNAHINAKKSQCVPPSTRPPLSLLSHLHYHPCLEDVDARMWRAAVHVVRTCVRAVNFPSCSLNSLLIVFYFYRLSLALPFLVPCVHYTIVLVFANHYLS